MTDPRLSPPVVIDDYLELRMYQMLPGRIAGFHALMEQTALPLFARHGIPRPWVMWQGHSGPLTPLYAYLLRWRSLDARMQAWRSFYADPDWQAALAANYAGRQRVDRSHVSILRPSAVWDRFRDPAGPLGSTHELRVHDVLNQDPNLAHQALADHDLPFLQARGGQVMGVFATWFGSRMNQALTLVAWPDAATLTAAARAQQTDPGLAAVREAERRTHGRPLLRGTDVHVMTPLPYGMPDPGD